MARFTTNFSSEALKRPISIEIVLPTDHMVTPGLPTPEANRPYRTLYILEGVTGDQTGPFNYTMLQAMAEDYNMAVVTAGGENMWWSDHTAVGDNYHDYIVRDVVNFTRRAFNLSRMREDTYIGGFSMGGYGAFVLGFGHPELFGKIVSLDAALNKAPILDSSNEPGWDLYLLDNYKAMFGVSDIAEYAGSINDYEYLAKRNIEEKRPAQRIFMACGKGDQLYEANVAFRDLLKSLGHNVTWQEFEGKHSLYSLNQGYDLAMKWLAEDLKDNFRKNYIYYGPDASCDGTNFAHWSAWYNVELNRE